EGQGAGVDVTGVAFGAAHRHFLAVFDAVQRVAGADDRRHAQFAGDDRGMAGAAAAVGDDGRGTLHHRFPVRVGHVGDEPVAGLHAVRVVERAHHAGDAAADLLAAGAALGDDLAPVREVVA